MRSPYSLAQGEAARVEARRGRGPHHAEGGRGAHGMRVRVLLHHGMALVRQRGGHRAARMRLRDGLDRVRVGKGTATDRVHGGTAGVTNTACTAPPKGVRGLRSHGMRDRRRGGAARLRPQLLRVYHLGVVLRVMVVGLLLLRRTRRGRMVRVRVMVAARSDMGVLRSRHRVGRHWMVRGVGVLRMGLGLGRLRLGMGWR